MKEPQTLYSLFHDLLTESMRLAIVSEAGIEDDRPSILRGQGGTTQPGIEWIMRHRGSITPLTLRHIDPPDYIIAGLVGDGDLVIPSQCQGPRMILLSTLVASESLDTHEGFYLSDVLGSSAFLFQVFLDLSAANEACGLRSSLPKIQLNQGSVQITVGGGLFSSGVGLLVACGAGLVGAPLVGPIAGATLATAGVVELAVGWRKAIAEQRKLEAEASKTDAERRLTEINIKIKELELERAYLEKNRVIGYDSVGHPMHMERREVSSRIPPECAEISRGSVRQNAGALAMSETYANHMLNRALPNFRLLRQKMAGVEVRLVTSPTNNCVVSRDSPGPLFPNF